MKNFNIPIIIINNNTAIAMILLISKLAKFYTKFLYVYFFTVLLSYLTQYLFRFKCISYACHQRIFIFSRIFIFTAINTPFTFP